MVGFDGILFDVYPDEDGYLPLPVGPDNANAPLPRPLVLCLALRLLSAWALPAIPADLSGGERTSYDHNTTVPPVVLRTPRHPLPSGAAADARCQPHRASTRPAATGAAEPVLRLYPSWPDLASLNGRGSAG
jgi:hypothetical protein